MLVIETDLGFDAALPDVTTTLINAVVETFVPVIVNVEFELLVEVVPEPNVVHVSPPSIDV